MDIQLHFRDGLPLVDSRVMADRLGNQHKNVMSLVTDYASEFEEFGALAFETKVRAGQQKTGGGLPERYALLNEDQCYFLLTLVRNTDMVVRLKVSLVKLFRQARELAADPTPPTLPTDPLDLLTLSLQSLQQHRQQIQELQQANIQLEHRLDNTPIRMHPEMEAGIKQRCMQLARVHPRTFQGAYHSFKEAFGMNGAPLARYDSLPAYRYAEAMEWLEMQTQVFGSQRPLIDGHSA